FVSCRLDHHSDIYLDLKGKHFLFDSESTVPFELLALKYRTKKAHLSGFTKLHIFVVSLRCEHSCHYCQVSRVSTNRALITEEILDFLRDHAIVVSPSLDGPEFIHNANRPRPGNSSYQLTIDG